MNNLPFRIAGLFIIMVLIETGSASGDGIVEFDSDSGVILIIKPIRPDNEHRKIFKIAKPEQNFSFGYWPDNPIIVESLEKLERRGSCDEYLSRLVDQHVNPVGYSLIEETKDGLLKYRIGIAPDVIVFLWFKIVETDGNNKGNVEDVPVGFMLTGRK